MLALAFAASAFGAGPHDDVRAPGTTGAATPRYTHRSIRPMLFLSTMNTHLNHSGTHRAPPTFSALTNLIAKICKQASNLQAQNGENVDYVFFFVTKLP